MESIQKVQLAKQYYQYMLSKEFDKMAQCLHPDIEFTSPLTELSGRDSVVEAAKPLGDMVKTIDYRAQCSDGNQLMLAYDFDFGAPIGKLRSAALMQIEGNQIAKIELFFDATSFTS